MGPLPLVYSQSTASDPLVSKRVAGSDAPTPLAPERVAEPRTSVAPHAAGRYTATIAMDQAMRDELLECTELLGHVIPSGSAGEVFAFALHQLVVQLRKRRFAVTDRPAQPRATEDPRHIPAHVRRAVSKRDGGCCAFTSDDGRRCGSRERLQFDHVVPVARGGESSVDNVRLLCAAHNQHAADETLGREFMEAKRDAAQRTAIDRELLRTHGRQPRLHDPPRNGTFASPSHSDGGAAGACEGSLTASEARDGENAAVRE